VAVVVICTVLGLYLHKKRKTKRELEEASQQGMSPSLFPSSAIHLLLISFLTGSHSDAPSLAAIRKVLMIDHMMAQRDWEY
jgi:hypothetical protein